MPGTFSKSVSVSNACVDGYDMAWSFHGSRYHQEGSWFDGRRREGEIRGAGNGNNPLLGGVESLLAQVRYFTIT